MKSQLFRLGPPYNNTFPAMPFIFFFFFFYVSSSFLRCFWLIFYLFNWTSCIYYYSRTIIRALDLFSTPKMHSCHMRLASILHLLPSSTISKMNVNECHILEQQGSQTVNSTINLAFFKIMTFFMDHNGLKFLAQCIFSLFSNF